MPSTPSYSDVTWRNTLITANFQKVFGAPIKEVSEDPAKWQKDPQGHTAAVNTYLQYNSQWRGLLPSPYPAGSPEDDQLAAANKIYSDWGLGPSAFYAMEIKGKQEIHTAWPLSEVYQIEFQDWRPFHEPQPDFNVEAHIMDYQSQSIERGRYVPNPYPKLDAATKKANEALKFAAAKSLNESLLAAASNPANLRV